MTLTKRIEEIKARRGDGMICSKCNSRNNTGWTRYVTKGAKILGVSFGRWWRIKCLDCGHEKFRGRSK
jgi:predicted nucleic-acid-binding Zn-ribbon protein